MTDEQVALARRAVACKGWRWLPGMRRQDGCRYMGSGLWAQKKDTAGILVALHLPDQYPDLTDTATLGAILQLVRETYGDNCACVFPIDYGPAGVMWQCRLTAGGRQLTQQHFSTEAEALVAALEGAS